MLSNLIYLCLFAVALSLRTISHNLLQHCYARGLVKIRTHTLFFTRVVCFLDLNISSCCHSLSLITAAEEYMTESRHNSCNATIRKTYSSFGAPFLVALQTPCDGATQIHTRPYKLLAWCKRIFMGIQTHSMYHHHGKTKACSCNYCDLPGQPHIHTFTRSSSLYLDGTENIILVHGDQSEIFLSRLMPKSTWDVIFIEASHRVDGNSKGVFVAHLCD